MHASEYSYRKVSRDESHLCLCGRLTASAFDKIPAHNDGKTQGRARLESGPTG
jgi:hypothetical protein